MIPRKEDFMVASKIRSSNNRMLYDYNERYTSLIKLWEYYKKKLLEIIKSEIEIEIKRDNMILFKRFGIMCYIEFKHNFNHGIIEYGTLADDDKMVRNPVGTPIKLERHDLISCPDVNGGKPLGSASLDIFHSQKIISIIKIKADQEY
jgi:hypothetical protein